MYDGEKEEEEGLVIKLYAPSVSQMQYAGKLKQYVMQAMTQGENSASEADRKAAKEMTNEEKKEKKITGEDFVMMLTSSNVDYIEAMNAFKNLLYTGAGKVEGKETLNKYLIDQLLFEDLENMLGKYLESFLLQSLIQKMKKEKL